MDHLRLAAYALRFPFLLAAGLATAFAIHRSVVSRAPRASKGACVASLLLIAVELLTTLTSWSFRGLWLQDLSLSLAYVAVCLLILLTRRQVHLAAPLLAVVFYSFWVDYWRTDPVHSETPLSHDVVLTRTYGGILAQDWEGVRIAYRPHLFPILERTLYTNRIAETEDCNEATIHVVPDPPKHQVTVSCGVSKQYVWAHVNVP